MKDKILTNVILLSTRGVFLSGKWTREISKKHC
jgi:hypothetical protein